MAEGLIYYPDIASRAPDGVRLVELSPEAYSLAILVCAYLQNRSFWVEHGLNWDDADAIQSELNRALYEPIVLLGNGNMDKRLLFAVQADCVGYASMLTETDTGQLFNAISRPDVPGVGTGFVFEYQATGSEVILEVCYKNTNASGIVNVKIDGVIVAASQTDLYSNHNANNVLVTYDITGMIASPGLVSITIEVLDKNASSRGYHCWLTWIRLS